MEDDIEIAHGNTKHVGTFLSIFVVDESESQCRRVAWVELIQCSFYSVSHVLNLGGSVWGRGWGGHGSFNGNFRVF